MLLSLTRPGYVVGSQEDVELAVGADRKAYETWSKLPGHVRARHMYSIARHVQKPARCVEVTDSAGRYKKIRSQYIETSNVMISRSIDMCLLESVNLN